MLREARADAGLSQRALAATLGKPQSYVHKCEVGDRQLNVVELRTWCEALGLPWIEFLQRFDALLLNGQDEDAAAQSDTRK